MVTSKEDVLINMSKSIEKAKSQGQNACSFDDFNPFVYTEDSMYVLNKLSDRGYSLFGYHYSDGSGSGLKVYWGKK